MIVARLFQLFCNFLINGSVPHYAVKLALHAFLAQDADECFSDISVPACCLRCLDHLHIIHESCVNRFLPTQEGILTHTTASETGFNHVNAPPEVHSPESTSVFSVDRS